MSIFRQGPPAPCSDMFTYAVCLSVTDATNWQAFITGQDETGRSTVRLCGEQNGRRFCVNDLLVQNKYAAVVDGSQHGMLLPAFKMQRI